MKKLLAAFGLSALVLGLTAAPAFAHAELDKKTIAAGTEADLVLTVPSEVDGVANSKVVVELPEGFKFRNCIASGNWACSFSQATDPSRDVITWAPVPGNTQGIETFQLRVEAPAKNGDAKFEVNQFYANGDVVNWDGDEDSEHPGPVIEVVEGSEASAEENAPKSETATEGTPDEMLQSGASEAPTATGEEATGEDAAADGETKDKKGTNWPIVGLIAGLMVLSAAVPVIDSARAPSKDDGGHH